MFACERDFTGRKKIGEYSEAENDPFVALDDFFLFFDDDLPKPRHDRGNLY